MAGMRRLAQACRLALALALPWPVAAGEVASWPQWQTILYQHTTPAALASLHAIGINAGQVIADRNDVAPAPMGPAIAPFLDQNMRWYVENIASDFYAAYHRWQPDAPVNAAFLQAEARHRRNPGDLAAFIRRPSLCDPAWRAKIAARLERVVDEFRPYRPLYYSLADEAGIGDLSAAWDFDFSPCSLAGFRIWLTRQYPSLAALNAEWGSHFASFSAVVPMTTDEALRSADNLAPWADFKAWMDVSFAEAVAFGGRAVHAADRHALVALEGGQIPGWGGYDYARLAPVLDVMEIYDFGDSVAIAQAMNPRLITLMTIAGDDDAATHALWHGILHGMRGVILWDEDQALARPDGTLGPWGRRAAPLFEALAGRLGRVMLASAPLTDPIALLYSPASFRVSWLLARRAAADDWARRGADLDYAENDASRARAAFLAGLRPQGWQPRILDPATLAGDGLLGMRVLLLPQAIALSAGEVAAIRRFVAGGGVVIADTVPGVFDDHGRRRARPALADLFAAGQRAVLLDPVSQGVRLQALLVASGLTPPVQLTTAAETAAAGVAVVRRQVKDRLILGIERDFSPLPATPWPLVLHLPSPCQLGDLVSGRDFGWHQDFAFRLDPVTPNLFTCAAP